MDDHWIPDGLLRRYRAAFAPSHYTPFAVQRIGAGWFTENRRGVFLTDGKIQAHLESRYYVGPISKTYAQTIAVDLDRGRNWRSLDRRTRAVCGAFPEASPLMFSTPSGGRHLHFMLDLPAWSQRASAFARDRLTEAGIEIADGSVEVYPSRRALRAPLGRDCYLLDPDTLDPVDADRTASLYTLDQILRNEQYDQLTVPPDYEASTIPEPPPNASRRILRRSTSEFMQRCDRWRRVGLTGPSQRNQAFLDLQYYMRVVEGLDADQVEAALWTWIRQNHNGHSKEFNRNPEAVRRKVKSLVQGNSWKPELVGSQSGGAFRAPETARESTTDLEARIQAYVDQNALGYSERCFLADLLRYAHKRGRDTLDGSCIAVEIPSRTLKYFCRDYGRLLAELIDAGVVAKARNYGANIGRCATYRLPRLDS
jgi:hypothetical protein